MSREDLVRAAVVALSLCTPVLITCSSRGQTTGRYEKQGISFSVPPGWSVTKERVRKDPESRLVIVQSATPLHALVVLMCLPPTSADTLPHFATKWAQDFRTSADEDKDVSSLSTAAPESITDEVAGQVREGVLLRFDINGSPGDSVPHEDRLYVVLGTKYKVMTVFQAPTSELPTVRRDAEALLRSLRVE